MADFDYGQFVKDVGGGLATSADTFLALVAQGAAKKQLGPGGADIKLGGITLATLNTGGGVNIGLLIAAAVVLVVVMSSGD